MDNQTIISTSLGFNNTTLTNTLTILSDMQQHGESLLKTTLEQTPWLPGSSKDVCLYWVDSYSTYLKNLKAMADLGIAEMERISLPLQKLAANEPRQAIAAETIPNPLPAKKSSSVREKKDNAKETLVDKMLPEKMTVNRTVSAEKTVPNEPPEKPAPQNVSAEKPAARNVSKEPAAQNANMDKPVIQDQPDTKKDE